MSTRTSPELVLIGRDEERKALRQALSRTSAPETQGTVVLIEGVAGIGKTALVRDLIRELAGQGIFHCQLDLKAKDCPSHDSYHVVKRFFSTAFKDHFESAERGERVREILEYAGILVSAFPSVITSLPQKIIGGLDAGLHRQIEAVRRDRSLPMDPAADNHFRREQSARMLRMLLDEPRCRPTVLIIDNFDMIDLDSAAILLGFAEEFGGAPLLIVLTYQREELARNSELREYLKNDLPEACAGNGMALEKLWLTHLDARGLWEYVRSVCGPELADHEGFLASLNERTGGNPLFLGETLAYLGSSARRIDPVSAVDHLTNVLPGSSERIIDHRIARFHDDAEEHFLLHQHVSVAGPTFNCELGAAVTRKDVIDFCEILDNTSKAYGFIEPLAANRDYGFRHALIYEGFKRRLSPRVAKMLHHLAAKELTRELGEGAAGGQHARVAMHHMGADEPGLALPHLQRAVDAAIWDHAYHELVELCPMLIEALDAAPDGNEAQRADAALTFGRALELLGRKDEAASTLMDAVRRAEALDDPERLAACLTYCSISLFHVGRHSKSEEAANQALEIYRPVADDLTRAQAIDYGNCLDWVALNHRSNFRLKKALDLHQQARDVARRSEDKRLEAHATANIGAVYIWDGKHEEVAPYWEEALLLSSEPGKEDWPWVAHYTIDVGLISLLCRDYDRADEMIGRGLAIAEEHRYYDNVARGRMNLATLTFARALEVNQASGRSALLDRAEKLYEQALHHAWRHRVARLVWRLEHNLGNVHYARGQHAKAEDRYRSAINYVEAMRAEEPDKVGFMQHRWGPYAALMMLLWATRSGREEATGEEIANLGVRALHEDAEAFAALIVSGEFDSAVEGQKNRNFFSKYLVETE